MVCDEAPGITWVDKRSLEDVLARKGHVEARLRESEKDLYHTRAELEASQKRDGSIRETNMRIAGEYYVAQKALAAARMSAGAWEDTARNASIDLDTERRKHAARIERLHNMLGRARALIQSIWESGDRGLGLDPASPLYPLRNNPTRAALLKDLTP